MRRFRRTALVLALLAAVVAPATSLGATQIAMTGSPGAWSFPEAIGTPGATCEYEGAMGSSYLTRFAIEVSPRMLGWSAAVLSVGYRPVLQSFTGGAWTTVKYGVLHTANASSASYVALPVASMKVPPDVAAAGGTLRLALRLIWYRADASIRGTRTVVVSWLRQLNGTVGTACAGRIQNVM